MFCVSQLKEGAPLLKRGALSLPPLFLDSSTLYSNVRGVGSDLVRLFSVLSNIHSAGSNSRSVYAHAV